MSLFSWFSRKPSPPTRSAAEPLGLLNADATVPLASGRQSRPLAEPPPPQHAANRKNERMERRELLYTVVRDAMIRAGVLSASYKFKVLSLDQRGRQFLVMMDLAREYGLETARLSEIEALIAQTAKTRYDILVSAVYWRINDHVAVGLPQNGAAHRPVTSAPPRPAVAAPVVSPAAATAPQVPAPLIPPFPNAPARQAPRCDPIEADEVAAFKRALATQAGGAAATPAAAAKPGISVRSGPLLPPSHSTGFADTEMFGADSPSQDLGSTQYGTLN